MKIVRKICYFLIFGLMFVSISCCDFRIVREINSFDNCFVQGFYKGEFKFNYLDEGTYYLDVKYISKDEFYSKNGFNVVYDVAKDKYVSLVLYVDMNENRTYCNFTNLKYDSTKDSKHCKAYIDDNDYMFELWCDREKSLDNHEQLFIYGIELKSISITVTNFDLNEDYRK